MGVKYLYSFVKEIPQCLHKVNIEEEIKKWKSENPDKVPTIIIDFGGFPHLIITQFQEYLCGGRNQIHMEIMEEFLKRFKNLGVKLVVFVDGPAQTEKYDTILERGNRSHKLYEKTLNDIYSQNSLDFVVKNTEVKLNTYSFLSLKDVIKKYAESYKSIDNEADKEAALYANQNNAIAIITNDTDFLIFDGNWKFWSVESINLKEFTTDEINKSILMNKLNLNQSELPIFSTLAGNDFVSFDMLRHFHRRLGNVRNRFYNLSQFINNMRMHSEHDSVISLELYIASLIFSKKNMDFGIELVKNSLDFYNLEKINLPNQHINLIAYKRLMNLRKSINSSYYDGENPPFDRLIDLCIKIFSRTAGIVLKHIDDREKFPTKIICNRGNTYVIETYTPEYPTMFVPKLEELDSDDNIDDIRFKLLAWCVSDKLNPELIKKIEKKYLVMALTLYFLVENELFTVVDADLFMHTLHTVYTSNDIKSLKAPQYLNFRAFQLPFVYGKTMQCVRNVFKVCGLKKLAESDAFDGVYFHHNYESFLALSIHEREKLLHDINDYRIYVQN